MAAITWKKLNSGEYAVGINCTPTETTAIFKVNSPTSFEDTITVSNGIVVSSGGITIRNGSTTNTASITAAGVINCSGISTTTLSTTSTASFGNKVTISTGGMAVTGAATFSSTIEAIDDITVKKSTLTDTRLNVVNSARSGALIASVGGNLGLYDYTSGIAGWFLRSDNTGKIFIERTLSIEQYTTVRGGLSVLTGGFSVTNANTASITSAGAATFKGITNGTTTANNNIISYGPIYVRDSSTGTNNNVTISATGVINCKGNITAAGTRLLYAKGDTEEFRGHVGGSLTASTKNIIFNIPLNKRRVSDEVPTVKITSLQLRVRHTGGGYLIGTSSGTESVVSNGFNVSPYTTTITFAGGSIVVTVARATAYTATNNTPVSVEFICNISMT